VPYTSRLKKFITDALQIAPGQGVNPHLPSVQDGPRFKLDMTKFKESKGPIAKKVGGLQRGSNHVVTTFRRTLTGKD
jgi:hypothetical protein